MASLPHYLPSSPPAQTMHLPPDALQRLKDLAQQPRTGPSMDESLEAARNFLVQRPISDSDAQANRIARNYCPYIVAVSRDQGVGRKPVWCSGVIAEADGDGVTIVSTAYIFNNPAESEHDCLLLPVTVQVAGHKTVEGKVQYVDRKHNISLICVEGGFKVPFFSPKFFPPGIKVLSLGRRWNDGLMVSQGKLYLKNDDSKLDEIMSSSCSTSGEWLIGGALVEKFSGDVVGINLTMRNGFTCFLPSTLFKCYLSHIKQFGKVIRPCLGLKLKHVDEVKPAELEAVSLCFSPLDGVFVSKVIEGSSAEEAGIRYGDIITHFDGYPVGLPAQVTSLLLHKVANVGLKMFEEKNFPHGEMLVEVHVKRACDGLPEMRSTFLRIVYSIGD